MKVQHADFGHRRNHDVIWNKEKVTCPILAFGFASILRSFDVGDEFEANEMNLHLRHRESLR